MAILNQKREFFVTDTETSTVYEASLATPQWTLDGRLRFKLTDGTVFTGDFQKLTSDGFFIGAPEGLTTDLDPGLLNGAGTWTQQAPVGGTTMTGTDGDVVLTEALDSHRLQSPIILQYNTQYRLTFRVSGLASVTNEGIRFLNVSTVIGEPLYETNDGGTFTFTSGASGAADKIRVLAVGPTPKNVTLEIRVEAV